jgi:HEAT repeat protein
VNLVAGGVLAAALLLWGAQESAWAASAGSGPPNSSKGSRRGKVSGEKARAPRPPLSADALDKLRELLAGPDPATVAETAKALGEASASNASVPLIEMLAAGARPAAVIAAIDALGKLRDPASIEVLNLYAGNRSADARRHAVQAMGVFADARVVPILVERLGDAAPDVRAAAAEALATRGEKSVAPRLLALLRRNDAGAAGPLGTLAPISMLPQITELQGSVDDANIASALGELLKRQDVPEPVRIDVVKTLGRVPGAASTTALVEYIGTLTASDTRTSKRESEKIVDERSK